MTDHMIGDEGLEAPDLMNPVTGYRSFALKNERLWSPVQGRFEWTKRDAKAACMPVFNNEPAYDMPHRSPHDKCQCGFYAYYNPLALNAGSILGLVTVHGVVFAHKTGMRAESVRIEALGYPNTGAKRPQIVGMWGMWGHGFSLPDNHGERLEAVAVRLGVPLVPESELPELAEQYGQSMPDELKYGYEDEADASSA